MKGLFRGLPASLMGIVPYSGTDLAMFYTLKARWMAANPDAKVISIFVLFWASHLSGTRGPSLHLCLGAVVRCSSTDLLENSFSRKAGWEFSKYNAPWRKHTKSYQKGDNLWRRVSN